VDPWLKALPFDRTFLKGDTWRFSATSFPLHLVGAKKIPGLLVMQFGIYKYKPCIHLPYISLSTEPKLGSVVRDFKVASRNFIVYTYFSHQKSNPKIRNYQRLYRKY
jgi:hypothetical protein